MEDDGRVTFARRAVVARRLFFSHRIVRPLFVLAVVDVLCAITFAVVPDGRAAESDQVLGIFVAQGVLAWINAIISALLIALIWTTYSVTQRELTFERQSRLGYLIVSKVGQILLCISMTAYPTFLRNFGGIGMSILCLAQVAYALFIVQRAREAFTRRIRPPLVIKALLDMKGEALGATKAQPLTLGMLERLEGIVKVKDQQKFNVRSGRDHLIGGVLILLFFSFAQWTWEFTKILTYQNRFLSRTQIEKISAASNLPMYWPGRAYDPETGTAAGSWAYHPGGAGCQDSSSCHFPRSESNTRLQPAPHGDGRVVLIVIGGLAGDPEYTSFLRFRRRVGWDADAIELMMSAMLPTNAVPNWSATLTGLSPDLVGILGNRNIGTTAYDNIFRMMRRFHDRWYCDTSTGATAASDAGDGSGCAAPEDYTALMSASPWFTGLVKTDLPHLVGDGSVSHIANEEDFFDRSEVYQRDTKAKDAARFAVARRALSDARRRYHFTLLHLTDADSQATTYGASDIYNQANMNETTTTQMTPQDAPWTEYIPPDAQGFLWRANSYKRALARAGDLVSQLIDEHGDEQTTFLIMGDHGHVPPGGMGGASPDVRHVPLFAYRKGSGLGDRQRDARRVAGTPEFDAVRFVARARTLSEAAEALSVVPNDVCDIMGESVGSAHMNTCDEWREEGAYTVETVDVAPTVMALLGLPVPRHAVGVFIDDIVGSIGMGQPLRVDGGYPLLGGNCSRQRAASEAAMAGRLDRTCQSAFGPNENPSIGDASTNWDADLFTKWIHALHYRDLYQQKLAFVRGYLGAIGADRLEYFDSLTAQGNLGFLRGTPTAGQYYDEGADGRCAAYDPFNRINLNVPVGSPYRYTIQALEFGKCGSCSSAERIFLTGEELTVQGKVVCAQNDWSKVKQYYIQGVKGLMVIYWREVARTKRLFLARNMLLTGALGLVTVSAFVYLVAASTLADPAELYRRYRGEEYMRTYYRRSDVVACFWAVGLIIFYYAGTILTYYLLQNLIGHTVWDASVLQGTPQGVTQWTLIAFCPALGYAIITRGLYMFHYRYVDDSIEAYHEAAHTPVLCSPSRLVGLLVAFLSRSARTSDTGKVYLIRIYLTVLTTISMLLIASLHAVYSFIVPFIYRMNHVDATNWTLRFQLITVQLMSFPLWIDSWWSLYLLKQVQVDGVSVSQLYDMRSDKEERRVGGFSPEDEDESTALNFSGGDTGASSTAIVATGSTALARAAAGGAGGRGKPGRLGENKAAGMKEVERKLAEVELDRTLCMNRIAQLEEELDGLKEQRADAMTDARLNNEFLGRGFSDLQVLLESGFKQLEKFYLETGGGGGSAGGPPGCCASSASLGGGGAASSASGGAGGGGDKAGGGGGEKGHRSAVEETMANLREETSAALERQRTMLDALYALEDGAGPDGDGFGGQGGADMMGDDDAFFAAHAEDIEAKLRQARVLRDELTRAERQRDELSKHVSHLEREAVVAADEMEKANDDVAGVQAERDLLERKVNELRRELHAKAKEIEAVDAELRLVKAQQVRAMAKLSVQKAKAEKQLASVRGQLRKLDEDKAALFKEVSSLEAQLAQAQADREESRNWASTYRDMLLKVT